MFLGFLYFFHGTRQYEFDPKTKRILTLQKANSWFNCRQNWPTVSTLNRKIYSEPNKGIFMKSHIFKNYRAIKHNFLYTSFCTCFLWFRMPCFMYCYNLVPRMSDKKGQVHGLSLHISQFGGKKEALFQSTTLWHQTWGAIPAMNISFQERERDTSLHQRKCSSRTCAQLLAIILIFCYRK